MTHDSWQIINLIQINRKERFRLDAIEWKKKRKERLSIRLAELYFHANHLPFIFFRRPDALIVWFQNKFDRAIYRIIGSLRFRLCHSICMWPGLERFIACWTPRSGQAAWRGGRILWNKVEMDKQTEIYKGTANYSLSIWGARPHACTPHTLPTKLSCFSCGSTSYVGRQKIGCLMRPETANTNHRITHKYIV